MTTDYVVVGGGPAGAAFAIEAARRGASVALLEACPDGRGKLCGEFLSGTGCARLRALGADAVLDGCPRMRRVRFVPRRGPSLALPLPRTAASVPRVRLDPFLRAKAAEAGATLHAPFRAVRAFRDEGAWVVEAEDGRRVRGARLVLAEGRNGRIAASLGFATRPARRRRAALAWHAAGVPTSDAVEMFFFTGGYLGIAPSPGGLASVCGAFSGAFLARTGDDFDAIRSAFDNAALRERLADARPVEPVRRLAPVTRRLSRRTRRAAASAGVLLLGDAAGTTEPIFGRGMARALALSGASGAAGVAAARGSISPPPKAILP